MRTIHQAILTVLLATITAPLWAATTTFTVSDVNDDAYGLTSTGDNWTDTKIVCGYASGYSSPYVIGAFRFNSVTIPQGATITHAYLRVQAYLTGTGSSSFTIKGEAYDSTGSYLYDPYIGARSVTSAGVAWSVASAWAEDAVYTSPDIKTVVQEIVSRAGWACNNALAIQLYNAASSGGYQMIYSLESAPTYGASAAQLIVEYTPDSCSGPVPVSENYIPGATSSPSLVPTYLNNPTMYCSCASGGLCWATCTADIMAYWERTGYGGVKYWNLFDNGTPPLLQPSQPTAPGHDQADVFTVVSNLTYVYYCLGRQDEKVLIEAFANQTNGLAFTATYYGPVSSTADRTTFFYTIKSEIDAGRPIGIGSWGTHFGGAHQIPGLGYKEMSPVTSSMVYIHLNTGGTQNEYHSIFASDWGDLDMDQIIPGGTPVDHYEARGDNSSATPVSLNPDHVYDFRQTHNFSTVGDVDWVRLSTVAGRQYIIQTTNLGTSCDTILTLYAADGTTQLAQDDNGGGEARASKIAFRCWVTGNHFIRVTGTGSGAAANYDLQVSYSAIGNVPPTLDAIANQTINEDAPTVINLTGIGTSPDSEQLVTNITATSGNTGLIPNPTVTYTAGNPSGTLSFTPVANANGGPVTITVTAKDNGGTASGGVDTTNKTFTVMLNAVNDAPSFVKGANQNVTQGAGAQTVANWATAISAGPANEISQTLDFIVTNNNNGLFSAQPALSAAGTLTYTPAAAASGSATVSAKLHDNGGTAYSGVDTSPEQIFTLTVTSVARPQIVSPRRVLPDKFAFSYDSLVSKSYVVEANTNVNTTTWTALQTNAGDGTRQSYTNSVTATPRRYFRVRMQ
jgi:hypothetical protein